MHYFMRIVIGTVPIVGLLLTLVLQDMAGTQRVRRLEIQSEDGGSVFCLRVEGDRLVLERLGQSGPSAILEVSLDEVKISLEGGSASFGKMALPGKEFSGDTFGMTVRARGAGSAYEAAGILAESPSGEFGAFAFAQPKFATCGARSSDGNSSAGIRAQEDLGLLYAARNTSDASMLAHVLAGGDDIATSVVQMVQSAGSRRRTALGVTAHTNALVYQDSIGEEFESSVDLRSGRSWVGLGLERGKHAVEVAIQGESSGVRMRHEDSWIEAVVNGEGPRVLARMAERSFGISWMSDGIAVAISVATARLRALIEEADLSLEWRTDDDLDSPPRWAAKVPGEGQPESIFR